MLKSLSFTEVIQRPELMNSPEIEELIRFFNCLISLSRKLSNSQHLDLSESQAEIYSLRETLLMKYQKQLKKIPDTPNTNTELSDVIELKIKQLILIDIIYLLKNFSSHKKKYFVTHLLESSENLILENPISDYIEFYNQLGDIEIQLIFNKESNKKILFGCDEEQVSILFNLVTTEAIYVKELNKLNTILADSTQFSFSNYVKLYIIGDTIEKISVLKSFDIPFCNDD